VAELMLKKEVVDAVRAGKFHVWAVGHVDEALELLTGVPAGKRLADGTFEPDTVNFKVDQKLKEMMELAKELMRGEEGAGKSETPGPSCPSCGK
jgi:predicted ATP-dependent protease